MSILKELFDAHSDLLSRRQKDAVKEHIRRGIAAREFARPAGLTDLEFQSAFVTFEREFCEQPLYLFGQDVPSIAHTIVRVFRARQVDGSHTMEPTEEILAARVSEKALTECMLSTDRGDPGAPLTFMQLGDFSVPVRAKTETAVAKAAQVRQAERQEALRKRMDEMRAQLGPQVTKPNAMLRDAAKGLRYNARDVLSGSFDVMRHMENMSQLRNQILTEAAHAALHAEKVTNAMKSTTALLPSPEPVDWNAAAAAHPLVHKALDPISPDLREALREMIIAEMRQLAKRHPNILNRIKEENGVEYINIGMGRELSEMLSFSDGYDDDKQRIERMGNLWNTAFNPHIVKDRPKYAADQGTMRLSQRQGDTRHIHSSLPPMEQSYFSLSINPAYYSEDFGEAKVRSRHMPIIELEIVGQDLMTALRGHPAGKPVPCSIRHLCGVSVPRQDQPLSPISIDIADVDKRIQASAEAERVESAVEKVISLAHAKRSGKTWRKELDEALADFEDAMCAISARAESEVAEGHRRVNMHTADHARQMLSEISDLLPAGTLKVLGLPGS